MINLSGEEIITMHDIIKTSQKILGKTVKIIENNASTINIRNPSNNKAKTLLNWKPKILFSEGLKSLKDYLE